MSILLYTLGQVSIIAILISPTLKAGMSLKNHCNQFYSFLILAIVSGIGLFTGWIIGT